MNNQILSSTLQAAAIFLISGLFVVPLWGEFDVVVWLLASLSAAAVWAVLFGLGIRRSHERR